MTDVSQIRWVTCCDRLMLPQPSPHTFSSSNHDLVVDSPLAVSTHTDAEDSFSSPRHLDSLLSPFLFCSRLGCPSPLSSEGSGARARKVSWTGSVALFRYLESCEPFFPRTESPGAEKDAQVGLDFVGSRSCVPSWTGSDVVSQGVLNPVFSTANAEHLKFYYFSLVLTRARASFSLAVGFRAISALYCIHASVL